MNKLVSILAVLFLAACSSGEKDVADKPELAKDPQSKPSSSIEAKQVAAEQDASHVAEISFAKGKTRLTPEATKNLDKILKEARAKGKLEEVTVLSWADQEYPSVHANDLPDTQKRLAENRAKAVKEYLSKQGDLEVATYSMAERAGAFENLLSTKGARMKKSLETAGIPNTDTSIKAPSKASKAIVLFQLESDKD